MITRILLLLVVSTLAAFGQSNVFSEFYVNHGGTNVNSGSTTDAAAIFTFNSGSWDTTTGAYVALGADLTPVTVGMFASVYADGATAAVFVGRITNVDNGTKTINVSETIKSGTPPVTGSGTRTIKVGGAWYGPYITSTLPFGFVQTTMTNTSASVVRVNFLGDAAYINTNATTCGNVGPIVWSGYTNFPGDGGKMFYSQNQPVAAIDVFLVSQPNQTFTSMIISNASANASYNWDINAAFTTLYRCTSIGSGNNGIYIEGAATGARVVECDAHNCCRTTGHGIWAGGNGANYIRCLSYSNAFTVAGTDGFHVTGDYSTFVNCIAAKNGGDGIASLGVTVRVISSDCYSNAGSGLRFAATAHNAIFAQNSNFLYNKVAGITNTVSQTVSGLILNCGFGTGVAANLAGNVIGNRTGILELGTVNYASGSTPWNDPNNMDFRIVSSQAKAAGIGSFNATSNVGFPDIGAVQGNDNIPAAENIAIYGQ